MHGEELMGKIRQWISYVVTGRRPWRFLAVVRFQRTCG